MADGRANGRHGQDDGTAGSALTGIPDALTALMADLEPPAGKPAILDRARLDALEENLATLGVRFRMAEGQAAHRLADLVAAIRHLSAPYLLPASPGPRGALSFRLVARLFTGQGRAAPGLVSAPVFAVQARSLAGDIAGLLSSLQTQHLFLDGVLTRCEALAESLRGSGEGGTEKGSDGQLRASRQELAHDLVDLVIDMTASCNILLNLLNVETEAFVLLVAGVDGALVSDLERDLPALAPHLCALKAGLLSARRIDTRRAHLAEVYHHRFGGARQATAASLPEGR